MTKASAPQTPSSLQTDGWSEVIDDGFIGLVGPLWLRTDDGTARLGFVADERHRNRGGNVQGGMIATLADRAMGHTARLAHGDLHHVTVQLDMHYIDSARIGEFIEARCRVVRLTRTLSFMEATIMAGDRLAATAHGIWKRSAAKSREATR